MLQLASRDDTSKRLNSASNAAKTWDRPGRLLGPQAGALEAAVGVMRLGGARNPTAWLVGVLGRGLPMGGFLRLRGDAAQSLGLAKAPLETIGREAEALCFVGTTSDFAEGDSGGVTAMEATHCFMGQNLAGKEECVQSQTLFSLLYICSCRAVCSMYFTSFKLPRLGPDSIYLDIQFFGTVNCNVARTKTEQTHKADLAPAWQHWSWKPCEGSLRPWNWRG